MKINIEGQPPIVIGKRVTVGAAILGVANTLAQIYPEHTQTILAVVMPVTFVVQLWLVRRFGVTK